MADSDSIFSSSPEVHIFYKNIKCCNPLPAMIHRPSLVDILADLW